MGYDIGIGNAVPFFSKEYNEFYAAWEIEKNVCDTALANSPIFPLEKRQ